jgi:hypothetical protein
MDKGRFETIVITEWVELIVDVSAAQIRAWATSGIEILPDLPAGTYYSEWKVIAEYSEGPDGQFILPNMFVGKYKGGSPSEGCIVNNDFVFDGVIEATAFFSPQSFAATGETPFLAKGKAPQTDINNGIKAYLFDTKGVTDFARGGKEIGTSVGTLRFIARYKVATIYNLSPRDVK